MSNELTFFISMIQIKYLKFQRFEVAKYDSSILKKLS